MTAIFEIAVFNTATQAAVDYSIEADTESRAVASLVRELESRPACTIIFEHTSYVCGHPGCPAAGAGNGHQGTAPRAADAAAAIG